jgi:hypothetical protein
MEILTTNQQIRDKVRWVLGDAHDERIALVAFVGNNADKFLANPKGIQLYCWLKVPGTNPNGLRSLLCKRVTLFSVDNLHIKLYWSRRRGAVLGSANLSENALENGVQFELAVYLPPKTINVESLIAQFDLESIKSIDDPEIDRFEKKYNLYHLRNKGEDLRYSRRKPQMRGFLEWRRLKRNSDKANFRLFWWEDDVDPPRDALQAVKQETGSYKYYGFINTHSTENYKKGDWVLCFRVSRDKNGAIRPSRLEWFIPEVLGKTRSKAWGDYNRFWFQLKGYFPPVPFSLKDPIFKQALTKVLIEYGNNVGNVVKNGIEPTAAFLTSLEKTYREI